MTHKTTWRSWLCLPFWVYVWLSGKQWEKPRLAERPMQITALLAAWSGSEMAVHSSTSSHVMCNWHPTFNLSFKGLGVTHSNCRHFKTLKKNIEKKSALVFLLNCSDCGWEAVQTNHYSAFHWLSGSLYYAKTDDVIHEILLHLFSVLIVIKRLFHSFS